MKKTSILLEIKKRVLSSLLLSLAFFILFAVSPNNTVHAQETRTVKSPHSLGLGIGQSILTGDLADRHSDSFTFSALYNYAASDAFGILIDTGISKHTDTTNTLLIRNFVPNLRVNFSYFDSFSVFGLLGFGFYNIHETIGDAIAGDVTTFGFSAGPGFDLRLSDDLIFGGTITFHNMFTKADPEAKTLNGQGMTIGGTFLKIMVNLRYVF